MELYVELFVEDLASSREFYTRVLGFGISRQSEDGFTELVLGAATLGLNSRTILSPGHPARPGSREHIARGVEIVLVVDDLEAAHRRVLASEWPLSAPLTKQPWGVSDFRLTDPDGCYIRVTARRKI